MKKHIAKAQLCWIIILIPCPFSLLSWFLTWLQWITALFCSEYGVPRGCRHWTSTSVEVYFLCKQYIVTFYLFKKKFWFITILGTTKNNFFYLRFTHILFFFHPNPSLFSFTFQTYQTYSLFYCFFSVKWLVSCWYTGWHWGLSPKWGWGACWTGFHGQNDFSKSPILHLDYRLRSQSSVTNENRQPKSQESNT